MIQIADHSFKNNADTGAAPFLACAKSLTVLLLLISITGCFVVAHNHNVF